jgi:YidC/Oxa1 family membrane protein insertase
MAFLKRVLKFIFSQEFIVGIWTLLKVDFNNQVLFLVYSKSDLQYIKNIIDILENDTINYKVIFFDKDEDLLKKSSKYFYLHPYFSSFLRTKLMVTTSVGLKKESFPFVKKLSHLPHSIVSLHMIYNEKAFNGFDYIFCSGEHHEKEIEEINRLYGCSIKALRSGYTKLDLLYQLSKDKSVIKNDKKVILLAPSWGKDNILEFLGDGLIDMILSKGYILIVRPHPMFFIEKQHLINKIKERSDNKNLFLENSLDSNDSFFKADVMISDYSGVAFEFAFLREKPVLFIDVAKKVLNPNYEKVKHIPVEIKLRDKIGLLSEPKIENVNDALETIIKNRESYKKSIIKTREDLLFNYLNSSKTAVDQIKKIVKDL